MSQQRKRQDGGIQERTVRASISFPEEQYSLLEKIASEHRVSLAWVVRDAIDGYLRARWPLLAQDRKSEKSNTK
jgi:hypothetical protein